MGVSNGFNSGNLKIVGAAKAAWDAARGKPYQWGGHTTAGFDCSGFVCYVLRQAYPADGFDFVTAADLFSSSDFVPVDGIRQLGDLICFPEGPSNGHDHIGIVYDTAHWIGSQTSTGVATVMFSNPFWSQKPNFFRRLQGVGS
jgi:cell wall-associated NlpC family hydrolase